MDPLENGKDLDFCRYSCGKTIHSKCFSMWEKSRGSICVFCRAQWYSSNLIIGNHKKVSMHPIDMNNINNDNDINNDNNISQNNEEDNGMDLDSRDEDEDDDMSSRRGKKKKKGRNKYRSRSRNKSRSRSRSRDKRKKKKKKYNYPKD